MAFATAAITHTTFKYVYSSPPGFTIWPGCAEGKRPTFSASAVIPPRKERRLRWVLPYLTQPRRTIRTAAVRTNASLTVTIRRREGFRTERKIWPKDEIYSKAATTSKSFPSSKLGLGHIRLLRFVQIDATRVLEVYEPEHVLHFRVTLRKTSFVITTSILEEIGRSRLLTNAHDLVCLIT